MIHEIDELLIGTVTRVKPYALFLTFEDGSSGLLHISEISDSYVRDIERYGSVGDQIKVKVVEVDKTNGFLKVSYKKVPQSESYNTHNNNARKAPVSSDIDFKPLADKLPKWIEETLEKSAQEEIK